MHQQQINIKCAKRMFLMLIKYIKLLNCGMKLSYDLNTPYCTK